MPGTILLTGANGSLAVPTAKRLLEADSKRTLLLTVRNPTGSDTGTEALRRLISEYPENRTSLHQLDLADLSNVNKFADDVAADISAGRLEPLAGIICNA